MQADPSAIGDRLREFRRALDLTQEALADRAGIARADVSLVESGKRKPSRNMLEALRRVFEVSTDWLLYGEGAAPHILVRASVPRLPDWQRDTKLAGMLGVPPPRPVSAAKAGIRDGVLERPRPEAGADMPGIAEPPAAVRGIAAPPAAVRSRFGYAERETAEDLRAHAAMDGGIRGTNFERLVMDDANWDRIQPVTGRELESLREYCAEAADPPLLHYVVVLEFLRKTFRTSEPEGRR